MNSQTNKDSKTDLRLESPLRFRWLIRLAAGMIAVLPFHAFLSVWLASLVGHYTSIRLWKEGLLVILVLGCLAAWLVPKFQPDNRKKLPQVASFVRWRRYRRLAIGLPGLITAYLVLLGIVGLVALAAGTVSVKALAYGLLLDSRFLTFFLAVWCVASHDDWITRHWRKLLLIPASIVIVFGLLQFTLLPADFLRHFGYNSHTIAAVETVDQKAGYQRVQSTLRGANPLGAYLVLVLVALGGLVLQGRANTVGKRSVMWYLGLLAAGCAVLGLTFSRSAWIGTLAALSYLVWQSLKYARTRRLLIVAGLAALLVLGAAGFGLRHNDVVQNTFFHTDEHSRSATSSNQGHTKALKHGLSDIARQPLGQGIGTAGPASVYNKRPARIAENYFIQIGQEAGVIGLALFVAINLLLGRELWRRRATMLPRILLASLIGITMVNMLSHAWTDDTISYIWWGLAGAALALPSVSGITGAVGGIPEAAPVKLSSPQKRQDKL